MRAVDARVISSAVHGSKVRLIIELPDLASELPVKVGWVGAFMKDGKPIPGTDFKVTKLSAKGAEGEAAAGTLPGNKPPTETVRLYDEKNNHSMLEGG